MRFLTSARADPAPGDAYQLPNALRMTVGTEEANRLVVRALAEFMGTRGVRLQQPIFERVWP